MTLELAKSRRLDALNKRSDDRILVKPAHYTRVALPNEGTVAGYLLDALGAGCSAEQLIKETGWSRSQVMVNLYKVAKKSGIGIRRCGDIMYMILPEGASHMYPRDNVVDMKPAPDMPGDCKVIVLA